MSGRLTAGIGVCQQDFLLPVFIVTITGGISTPVNQGPYTRPAAV